MIKKTAAGIYNWLPIGLKVLKKVEDIVRDNLNKFEAQEILMPMVQPAELWKESLRYNEYGKELLKFRIDLTGILCWGPLMKRLSVKYSEAIR